MRTLICITALIVAVGCGDKEASAKAADHAKKAAASALDDMKKDVKKTAAEGAAKVAAAATGDAAKEAKQIFDTRCVVCHGASGKGDGTAAATLDPKPANYTDMTWQKSITAAQIAKAIVEGGAAIGKSPLMPPNPDLAKKPKVVAELVNLIRAFGKK